MLIYTDNKKTLLTDLAVSLIHFLPKTETENITKYENFALEIKNIWKLNNVVVFPFVIPAEGAVTTNFQKYFENVSLTKNILRVGQNAVLLQTRILWSQNTNTNKTKKSWNAQKQNTKQTNKINMTGEKNIK